MISQKSSGRTIFLLLAALVLITFLCFKPGLKGEFTNWDDDRYVKNNVLIQNGSPAEIIQEYYMGNYHPLTLLSYHIEYKLWGNDPYIYHLNNLILHILNVLIIFFITFLLTQKNILASGFSALMFAIHPLHVESVSWVSERKDVLYALFFLAAWYCWIQFRTEKKSYWMILSFVAFLFSCLSKGMAVTFAGVVILTDYFLQQKLYIQNLKYYIPFISISLIFGVVAIFAQKAAGFIYLETEWSQLDKIALAGFAWWFYLWKMINPLMLSAFYPYPEKVSFLFWVYVFLIPLVFYLGWKYRKISRWFLFAPAFYTICISIVLQILSVGEAIAADRYFYVSSAGWCMAAGVALAWMIQEGSKKNGILKPAGMFLLLISGTAMAYLSYTRTLVWKDSLTLWLDTVSKYDRVPIAHYNLGVTYGLERNDYARAEPHFKRALEIRPGYPQALYNMAIIHTNRAEYEKSNELFLQLLKGKPDYPLAHSGMGYNLEKLGKYVEAADMYKKETEKDPDNYNAWLGLGINLGKSQKLQESLAALQKSAALSPDKSEPWVNMGVFHFNAGKYAETLPYYEEALKRNPNNAEAYFNRGSAYMNLGKISEAETAFRKTLEYNPRLAEAYINLGNIASSRGNSSEQIKSYQEAARLGHPGAVNWLRGRNITW